MSWSDATHSLVFYGEIIPVRREDGAAGGSVLYSREEWEADARADWEQQPDGTVTFQGQATNAILVEKSP